MTMPGGGGDRQANVTVSANVDPYVKSINAANAATLKFADALQKVDQQVLKITKIVGAGAMAAGGAGLLKAFGDVKTAAALEQSFKSLSAQATVTGTNVGKVTTEIIKLGTQIPVATTSLAAMTTQIAALGIQGTANLKLLTRQAEELAAATNTAPGQLMTGLIQLNQSLGGSIEDLGRYGSALTTVQAKMGVASTDVLNFTKGIEAVGAKAGVTEQQMIGMSAAFVKVGADGFAGAQAFNTIVNDMSDAVSRNSPRMEQYASLLGMTSQQFKEMISSGNSAQAFIDFITAVSNQGARATQVLEQFGLDGVRTQRVFAALTSGQANLAGAISETNAAFNENSAMGKAAAAAWDGFDSQLQRIANSAVQVKQELGATLLGPINMLAHGIANVSAMFGNLVRTLNDAPWPIGDTLTSLVTKTPALLLLGGAFLTATAALTRFTGAWRLMTGAIGINAFRGFMDGRAGRAPRELGESGRLGSMLYRRTYGMTQSDGMIGQNASRSIGSMVAGYPMMRFRQQMGGALDTIFHPLSPEKRNSGRELIGGIRQQVDPFSMQGMYQQGKEGAEKYRQKWIASLSERAKETDEQGNQTQAALRAQAMAGVLRRGLGPMEESKEFLERRRFNYVETARGAAIENQRDLISKMSHPQLAAAMRQAELAQYIERTGSDQGFVNPRYEQMGHRQLLKMANSRTNGLAAAAGAVAARDAGHAFDASLSEKETAKLANPFRKLAEKVTTITKEMASATGTAFTGIMDTIVAYYQAAVAKIEALAAKAKASVAQVYGYANPEKVAQMTTLPPVPGAAGHQFGPTALGPNGRFAPNENLRSSTLPMPIVTTATEEATKAATRAATETVTKITGPLPVITATRPGALPDPRALGAGSAYGFANGTQGSRTPIIQPVSEGGQASTRFSGQRLQNFFGSGTGQLASRAGSAIATGARGLGTIVGGIGSAFASIGKMATSLFSPQILIAATLLGPALYQLVAKINESRQELTKQKDYAGAAVQEALGRQVTTQSDLVKQAQKAGGADPKKAYGQNEIENSKAGEFQDRYEGQIGALQGLGADKKDRSSTQNANIQAWMQNYINGMVQGQNNGKPLDNAQQQQLREIMLAATGQNADAASSLMTGLDMTGGTAVNWMKDLGSAYGRSGQADLRHTLSGTAVQNVNSNENGGIASLVAAAGYSATTDKHGNDQSYTGTSGATGKLLREFVADYNEAHPDAKILDGGVDAYNSPQTPLNTLKDFVERINSHKDDPEYKAIYQQIAGLGLHFNADGSLKSGDLTRVAGLVGAAATGPDGNMVGSSLEGTVLNNAYRKGTGDKKGFITSLLGNPDDVGFSHNIDRTLGQLYQGSTIFSPDAITNMKQAVQAIQSVKDTLSPTDPAWQQLDKLQQATFANLASAIQMGGGQAFQLKAQSDIVGMMTQSGVTDANHDDIQKQNEQLQQQAQQAVATLNQYWTQVRDAKIQQQRGADDHHTQMVRMERDFNKQMAEAEYQRQKQVDEANYSFAESTRQMKYQMANAFGNPAQFVQSQYTMGAQSAEIGMKRQLDLLKRQQAAMKTLAAQGVTQDTIRLFGLDDPKNVQQAERFVKDFANNPQLVNTFNSQISDRLNIANAIAQDPNNTQFSELQRQFQHTADVAADAFNHSQDLSKQAYKQTMDDFETDYKTSTKRAADDLSRLAEDTTKSWQDVVAWAQNSGIPGIQALATAAQTAIGMVTSATGQLQQALGGVATGFATTLNQLSTDFQNFVAKNPAFAAANGIDTSNGGNGGGSTTSGLSGNKQIVNSVAAKYGWGSGLAWNDLVNIINKESGFNNTAQNPNSTAYGMFQFLNSTWAGTGIAKTSDPTQQAEAGLRYIKNRYGSPVAAWDFWQKNHWYANGAVFNKAQVIGVGEAGPETVLPLNTTGATFVAKTLRASLQMMGANPNLAQEVRSGRMQQFSSPARSEMTIHHTDASTNFTGDITVVAQDPNQMARSLQEKKRLQALTRPAGRR